MPVLEARVGEQDAALRDRIEEITAVGDELELAQARADGTRDRVGELGEQTRQLQNEISEQEAFFRESQERYRERVRAAYKGESLEGLAALLDGWLGSGDPGVARVLLESRQSMAEYEEDAQALRNTRRQVSQKKNGYERALAEQRAASAELHRREQSLDESIHRLGVSKAQTQARMDGLEAAERARVLRSRAATGGGEADRGQELGLANDRIVATDVDSISRKRYTELYKASARKYGFGPDWYILAAVGKVESNHGENMGPSSAGAMGPMQFLPSTWEASGVDGNGDGVANIMDPEDAVPAAAGYLKDGGAPRDWYRALYSYNHADWYVKKVLAVAEGYRRLAKDDKVGPYI
ncbi:MAG: lytic murein transglycosylase [Rubrobacteraceae bacterium]|nr:lytic murein transglycosylase [Rubrobacteraceae bacterium]